MSNIETRQDMIAYGGGRFSVIAPWSFRNVEGIRAQLQFTTLLCGLTCIEIGPKQWAFLGPKGIRESYISAFEKYLKGTSQTINIGRQDILGTPAERHATWLGMIAAGEFRPAR